jgi:predicted TIM-barrel fold metal-dependent hydrolase
MRVGRDGGLSPVLRSAAVSEPTPQWPLAHEIGVVDLMLGFPTHEAVHNYDFLRPILRDDASQEMEMPAEYMFKQVPNHLDEGVDPVDVVLDQMDHHGIQTGLVGMGSDVAKRAFAAHPDRFVPSMEVDPNQITKTVRAIRTAHAEHGIKAVTSFPSGCNPPVPVNDARYYPIYQVCIDLGIPVIVNAGIAGPRVRSDVQHVMHFDQVCYDFPDLTIVMRHGAEPWEELAVKLMLKWPGLHYMTSAFAPKHYPEAIVDYANTRCADKVLYAGYYPMGLSLDRIFSELPHVPFRDHVWAPFLRDNAVRLFGLDHPNVTSDG